MDKVNCLKKITANIKGGEVSDVNGDTVCDVLQEMADAVAKMPATQPRAVGAKMSFARKTLASGEKVILGFDGNISGILVMSDGSKIPFTISYVDIN